MMKKTWSAAMAALMVGSLLSGCSGSKTAAPSTTAASSEAATEAETTIEAFTKEETENSQTAAETPDKNLPTLYLDTCYLQYHLHVDKLPAGASPHTSL